MKDTKKIIEEVKKQLPSFKIELLETKPGAKFFRDIDDYLKLQARVSAVSFANADINLSSKDILEHAASLNRQAIHKEWFDTFTKPERNFAILVRNSQDALVGFINGSIRVSESDPTNQYGRLGNVFVDTNFQGKKIGSTLLNAFLDWCGGLTVGLDVIKYNKRAIAFYEKFGFKYVCDIEPDDSYGKEKLVPYIRMRKEAIIDQC